nr:head maturation protease, ClpP-related [uncultured Desulfobacter sp.]
MNKKWFSITAQGQGKTTQADIYIFDEIGGSGISARQFISELKNIDTVKINLHINSPGGNVFDGIAIQSALKQHSANVTVFIDGLAASIASIIALAGDEITIADNAYVMIHNPTSIVYGEAKDMAQEAELLEKVADGMAGDYSRKMDISVDAARELMDAETWYLGREAVDAGFADATFEGTRAAASFNIKRFAMRAPGEVLQRFSRAKKNTPQKRNKTEITDMTGNGGLNIDERVRAALRKDRERQAKIRSIGGKFGFEKKAEEYARSGHSVEDFNTFLLNKAPKDLLGGIITQNQWPCTDCVDVIEKIKARRMAKYGTL